MHIWGQAPDFKQDTKSSKYTIYGIDSGGKEIIELDPRILTQKP